MIIGLNWYSGYALSFGIFSFF